uniref:Uncharacterized protein n=1 Tax=Oryza nivara TaxID=4536 RepID=A0A0E0HZL9_ORYNI
MADEGEPVQPPRLEDAGLEDCFLPPESITDAVSSHLTHFSFFDDNDDNDEEDGENLLPLYGGGAGG